MIDKISKYCVVVMAGVMISAGLFGCAECIHIACKYENQIDNVNAVGLISGMFTCAICAVCGILLLAVTKLYGKGDDIDELYEDQM